MSIWSGLDHPNPVLTIFFFSWVRNRNENQRERIGDGGKIQGERSKDGGENDDDVWFGYGNGRKGRPIRAL